MKKYNIFCEIKIVNIILIILGLGLTIFSVVSQGKLDYTSLIITILLILILYITSSAISIKCSTDL